MQQFLTGGLAMITIGKIIRRATFLGDDLDSFSSDMNTTNYNKFKKHVQSGDLVLTSSPTSISRFVTESLWSHCGIVWKHPETNVLYEWSSHRIEEAVTNSDGKYTDGCQLVPLDYLAADNGTLFWRQVHLDKDQRKTLTTFIHDMQYKIDFSNFMELGAYFGPVMAKLCNGFGTGMVCSHLVGLTYMTIDAMASDRHLSQYAPETFATTGDASWLVPISPHTIMVIGFDTSRLISIKKKI